MPVAAFAAVMGVCGLGLSWRAAAQVLAAPPVVGEALVALAGLLLGTLTACYTTKLVCAPASVAAEFRDPTRSSYFGCFTIALLVFAVGVLPYAPRAALGFWAVGASGQFVLFLTLFGRWIAEPTDVAQATPAWFIPIVGNAAAPLAGMPLGFRELSWFLFAVGLVSWLAFLPLILNRLVFHHEKVPHRLAPSLALLVSSPAVCCLAWLQLTGHVDEAYRLILFSALFFALLVLRLWQHAVRALPVSTAWWAYTFPSAALTTGLVRYREHVPGVGEGALPCEGKFGMKACRRRSVWRRPCAAFPIAGCTFAFSMTEWNSP